MMRAALTVLWFAGLLLAIPAWAQPTGITTRMSEMGAHLLSDQGYSLYTYAQDRHDLSVCNDACSATWPPVKAAADAKADGDWTPIPRKDGSLQWSFKGKPLYRFARDPAPGTTLGNGAQTVWHLAIDPIARPSGIEFRGAMAGYVAANGRGMTLYTHEGETAAGKGRCADICLRDWRPASAPAIANPVGAWSVVSRNDGVTQWAYRGQPLYLFSGDIEPGDVNGPGDQRGNSAWRPLILEAAPSMPGWVKFEESDEGAIMADQRGMTIYSVANIDRVSKSLCLEACIKTYWRPVLAAENDQSMGNWSIVKRPDDTRQWAYRGRLIFTHTRDAKPGDILGHRFADGIGDFGWDVIPAGSLIEKSSS